MMQTISKEALDFLSKLKENNNREWFNEYKPKFKTLEKDIKLFYQELGGLLNQHDDIEKVKAYRIYRDIRFSKDKTPYKSHYAAHFARHKPELRGGYYLHISPGDHSFVGAGFWNPEKDDLKRVRKEWEMDATEIRAILNDKVCEKHWGKMTGNSLKTAPMGFDREHPDIDLINYKQWIFKHQFSDEEVLSADFCKNIDLQFKIIRPFFDYMTEVLTTDMNGVSLLENKSGK